MAGTSLISRGAIRNINTFKIVQDKFSTRRQFAFNTCRHFSVTSKRNMKLVQFRYYNSPELHVGYVENHTVIDLSKADPSLPKTLLEILRNGDMETVKRIGGCCSCSDTDTIHSTHPAGVDLSSVTLAAPIHGMDKVLCVGLNYKDHCHEQKLTPPAVPMIFSKFASCVVGPNDPVKLREITQCVDWEVELTLVVGKTASNVKAADAYDYILGYTVAQDISARDWQKQKNGGQFLLGKAMDTFCPIGPWIVTGDEIGDPQKLNIRCSVNGSLKQTSNTDQLVHKIPDVFERLTSVMTLLPGDIILTGTPGGVGMYRDPPEYLQPGSVVESEIEKIGVLTTRIEKF